MPTFLTRLINGFCKADFFLQGGTVLTVGANDACTAMPQELCLSRSCRSLCQASTVQPSSANCSDPSLQTVSLPCMPCLAGVPEVVFCGSLRLLGHHIQGNQLSCPRLHGHQLCFLHQPVSIFPSHPQFGDTTVVAFTADPADAAKRSPAFNAAMYIFGAAAGSVGSWPHSSRILLHVPAAVPMAMSPAFAKCKGQVCVQTRSAPAIAAMPEASPLCSCEP